MKTVWTTAAGAAALIALMVTMPGSSEGVAVAAAPDVRLASVGCAFSPEVVEVKNFGTDAQDLAGWQLQSDGNNSFDLTLAGTIPAGGSIFIESGSGAQASFVWSQSEIFRNNDPTDYARLVDDTGASKGQVLCGQATVVPTPAPAVVDVPNGGGSPVTPPDGLLSPAVLVYAGGSTMAAVAGIALAWLGVNFSLGRRQKRGSRGAPPADAAQPAPASGPPQTLAAAPGASRVRQVVAPTQPLLLALIVALAAAILVALLLQAQDSSGRR